MPRSARLLAVAASLAAAAAPMTTRAFAPDAPLAFVSNRRRRRAPIALSYRAGAETAGQEMTSAAIETTRVAVAPHLDDTTYASLLTNPSNLPVLVDCYVSRCGPCKLIERSLDTLLPAYSDRLLFCKWDADKREHSQRFVELLREHDMTFRKLPTLVLIVGGRPVAIRSGMATAGQLERFLEGHLPARDGIEEEEECVDEVNLRGERFLCEEG
ncbi:hypothetical protein ACHAXT_002716 [Thalassiosira profunda]